MITIKINYVDGGYSEWNEEEDIINQLNYLEINGYKGKVLLDNLITDDWGVPPKSITFEGVFKDKDIKKVVFYD